MATKATLASSTTLSNSAGNVPPTEKIILAAAQRAFADIATSASLAGSAVQRLAYAIMCRHQMMADNDNDVPKLSNCPIGSEAFKVLQRRMVLYFLGKPEKTKKLADDKTAAVKTTRTTRTILLGRAMKLTAILAAHHITFASFNDKVGAFPVPCAMLVAKGDQARGILATEKTILLDNRPCAVETTAADGLPKLLPIRASVAQVVMVNTPKDEREPGGSSDGLEDMVKAVHDILCPSEEDDDASETIHYSDYPDAFWTQLAEIAAWYDATVNNPAFKAKPVTKPVTKAA